MLTAYAAGSLNEGLALTIATHLSLCPACHALASDMDAIGGALLQSMPASDMAEDALARALALIETPERAPAAPAPRGAPPADVQAPEPLRSYLGGGRWRRLLPGIALIPVVPRDTAGGGAFLLRVAPGMALADHGHSGRELTLVLSGAYHDELGRFEAGDLAETDDTIQHRPVADQDAPCICLIATEAPLRYSGLIARALQPLFGI
jgi:putative transcriptional regulator